MKAASESGIVIEIEQDVLGGMMLDAECIGRAKPILRRHHFCEAVHQIIFDGIMSAFDRYRSASPQVVLQVIDPSLNDVFSARVGVSLQTYLARLAAHTGSGRANIAERARSVVEQWARVSVAGEAERIRAAALDPAASVAEIISTAGQAFDGIMSDVRHGPKKKSRVSIGEAVQSAFEAAKEARQRGRGLTGLTWGLSDLNALTGGMQRRDLTLVGARPSMGKTTFAVSCALNAAKAGHGVLVLSLEMDRDKLAARAASDIAYDWAVRVPYVDIIRGNVSEGDLEAVASATREICRLPLWIDDQAGISLTDLRLKVESTIRAAEEAGFTLDVLVVDHLGLIRASQRYAGNRTNEIAELTAALKSIAREFDMAVVLLSQLNRALEQRTDRRPQLSDLRDSGAIEQDADTILFLHREAYYLERDKGGSHEAQAERLEKLADCQNTMEIDVAKQRNGPIRRIDVFADMGCAAIRNGVRH